MNKKAEVIRLMAITYNIYKYITVTLKLNVAGLKA